MNRVIKRFYCIICVCVCSNFKIHLSDRLWVSLLRDYPHDNSWPVEARIIKIGPKVENYPLYVQYIPRNMHTVFALLCFVVVIHWLIFPYPSGLLHWHCGNLTIVPVPAKQPWWIWINTSCEFIMNDCITTTKQSTTKPCAYFLGYTVYWAVGGISLFNVALVRSMINLNLDMPSKH